MSILSARVDFAGSFEQENTARMEKVRSYIARRLKKACSHLSEEEFEALVNTMTKVQLGAN
ncbi:MAG: hypothetical protein M3P12_06485 [Gemmatimonadota bacterium]|nr:hypothetical protein [Gemmatimonadota bacterium]